MSQSERLKIHPRRIDVALLPSMIKPDQLRGRTVVVTDVLRATTTTIQALYNGCTQVLPQPSIEAAKNLRIQIPDAVLGGERQGRIIPGFDHGNSPLEYTRDVIGGRSLILATTNGTVAMEQCRDAQRVLIGAMVNLGAVCKKLDRDERVTIVCSGTDGEITSEDTVFAGALVERTLAAELESESLQLSNDRTCWDSFALRQHLSDTALIALTHWQQVRQAIRQGRKLDELFKEARGGINLVKVGLSADIEFAAQIDTLPIVPELDREKWVIK